MLVRGRARGDLAVDLAREHEVDQRLLEGLHLEEGAFLDRIRNLFGLALADQVGDAGVVDHDLDRGNPPSILARQQPLTDDASEDSGKD